MSIFIYIVSRSVKDTHFSRPTLFQTS